MRRERKQQVALQTQVKQGGGTVPFFVCLEMERGRLELARRERARGSLCGDAVRDVCSDVRAPKIVGGDARQVTVTLSAPTAGGTCPLQVGASLRAIQPRCSSG